MNAQTKIDKPYDWAEEGDQAPRAPETPRGRLPMTRIKHIGALTRIKFKGRLAGQTRATDSQEHGA